MEGLFKEVVSKIKEGGQMTVDAAVHWMKEGSEDIVFSHCCSKFAKVIDGKELTEEQVRKAFERAGPTLDFKEFEKALAKMAEDNNKSVDEYQNQLREVKGQIISAVEQGAAHLASLMESMKK